VGVTEPQASFSPCFGGPFLVWHPNKHAQLLAAKMKQHHAHVWLVNTGWGGVAYGSKPLDKGTLDFVKEFGLILFVFTIGLQLGPGFFAALRQQGVRLNALAPAIVILGAASAPLLGWIARFDPAAVLGIFTGHGRSARGLHGGGRHARRA
jgi:putative transport protein